MNIYVSNLNFRTRGESLQTLFGEYGEVSSANVITDRETGRSRGFGFVEMPDESAARNAINALNGFELDERAINVNEARPKTERSDRGGYGSNRGVGARTETSAGAHRSVVAGCRRNFLAGLSCRNRKLCLPLPLITPEPDQANV